MTHKRFKKLRALLRLWLVWRELKRRPRDPVPFVYGALCLLLLSACTYVGAPVKDPVAVLMRDGLPACSAFAVAKDKVVTAAHCVTGAGADVVTEVQWSRTASAFTPARVEYIDRALDFVVLTGEFNFTAPLKLRAPVAGEAVYSRSVWFDAITDGNVLAGAAAFRDTTMTIDFGWSGSPVFGLDGKVVGFVHSCEAKGRHCLPFNAQIGVLP